MESVGRKLTNIDKLLLIQDKDQQITQMVREGKEIPLRKEHIAKRLKQHEGALQKTKDELTETQLRIKEYELEVDTKKALITKYRKQQMEVKDNEAYRALESEIRETEKRISAIEDSELIFMEKLEERNASIAKAQKALDTESALVNQESAALDSRLDELRGGVEKLKEERAALASDIDASWLSKYQLIFKNKGDSAIVNSVNGTCAGCFMKLPPQLVHDARKAETMTSCSYCGRLLYFKIK